MQNREGTIAVRRDGVIQDVATDHLEPGDELLPEAVPWVPLEIRSSEVITGSGYSGTYQPD